MATPGALAEFTDQALFDRIEAGENPSQLATALGVHKSAIYHRFSNRIDYKLARRFGMQVRVEEGEAEIGTAEDQFTLARAREKFRAVAWRAEREFPDIWSTKPDISININNLVHVDQALAGAAGDLLNQLRTVAATPQTPLIAQETGNNDVSD